MGLTHSDHFQPGSSVNRPMVRPVTLTTSTFPLSKERVSSGVSTVLASRSAISRPFLSPFGGLGLRCEAGDLHHLEGARSAARSRLAGTRCVPSARGDQRN